MITLIQIQLYCLRQCMEQTLHLLIQATYCKLLKQWTVCFFKKVI